MEKSYILSDIISSIMLQKKKSHKNVALINNCGQLTKK